MPARGYASIAKKGASVRSRGQRPIADVRSGGNRTRTARRYTGSITSPEKPRTLLECMRSMPSAGTS
jgi:hypothetical protein